MDVLANKNKKAIFSIFYKLTGASAWYARSLVMID
jgi:hypothetical protein